MSSRSNKHPNIKEALNKFQKPIRYPAIDLPTNRVLNFDSLSSISKDLGKIEFFNYLENPVIDICTQEENKAYTNSSSKTTSRNCRDFYVYE